MSSGDVSCRTSIPSLDRHPDAPRKGNQAPPLPLLPSVPGCLAGLSLSCTRSHRSASALQAGGSPGAALYFTRYLPPLKGCLEVQGSRLKCQVHSSLLRQLNALTLLRPTCLLSWALQTPMVQGAGLLRALMINKLEYTGTAALPCHQPRLALCHQQLAPMCPPVVTPLLGAAQP